MKNPFIVAFSDCRRSVGIDIVIIQILLEKEDQRASLWGVTAIWHVLVKCIINPYVVAFLSIYPPTDV